MDRIALSERIEGLAGVFSSESKIAIDLKAMAHVLREADDDSFTKILNPKFSSEEVEAEEDKDAAALMVPPQEPAQRYDQKAKGVKRDLSPEEAKAQLEEWIKQGRPMAKKVVDYIGDLMSKGGPMKTADEEEEISTGASEAVENYWSREANDAVAQNLLRNVLGMEKSVCCDTKRKLTPDQTPDGKHSGVPSRPATLKPDQTPDQVDDLDSNMVEKSRGKVQKEAGKIKGPGNPDGTGPYSGTEECPLSDKDEKKKEASEEKEAKGKAKMVKCPRCKRDVLATTGYCLACKDHIKNMGKGKKTKGKKAAEESEDMGKKEMKAIKDIARAIDSLKELEKKEEEMGMGEPEHEEAEKEILDDLTEDVKKLEDLEKEEGDEDTEDTPDTEDMKALEAAKKTASVQPTYVVAEGIELSGGDAMDDLDIASPEIQRLSTLFN